VIPEPDVESYRPRDQILPREPYHSPRRSIASDLVPEPMLLLGDVLPMPAPSIHPEYLQLPQESHCDQEEEIELEWLLSSQPQDPEAMHDPYALAQPREPYTIDV